MKYIHRSLEANMQKALGRNKSVLLLGARQTGKTTLVKQFRADLSISFIQPETRQRYEKSPHLLTGEIEALTPRQGRDRPLIVLDEIQKIPLITDVVQDLIDREKALFILTGSSARKLWHNPKINLLPGRVVVFYLTPFTLLEYSTTTLDDLLLFGSLPGIIVVAEAADRETDLESYVSIYLEEEIRAEAVVRNIAPFARFLELAAAESGEIINLRKLSQEIGVSHTTIGGYFQILEDCLIAEKFDPVTESRTRKKLTKSCRYAFFDLGVRRLAAREGTKLPREVLGKLFEQFVGLELSRYAGLVKPTVKIRFWRDPDGPEVDWIIERDGVFTPIEVKLTDRPSIGDTRHLSVFLSEYRQAETGFVVCQVPRKTKLAANIFAIPWQSLPEFFFSSTGQQIG